MPMLNWDTKDLYPTTRRSIWVFVFVSIMLTGGTLYFWRLWFLRSVWKKDMENLRSEDETQHPQTVRLTQTPNFRTLDQIFLRRHDEAR